MELSLADMSNFKLAKFGFEANEDNLDNHLKAIKDCIMQAYKMYEEQIDAYKKENEELEAKLAKYEPSKEEEMSDLTFYQLVQFAAYTMDKSYYNKYRNNPDKNDDIKQESILIKNKDEEPPIMISINNKTLKFGKYVIVNKPTSNSFGLHIDYMVKLVNKQTFNVFKAYAEQLRNGIDNEKKRELFNILLP